MGAIVADWQNIREAVVDVADRMGTVLRSAPEPEARAVGTWSMGDAAAHLSHVQRLSTDLALGSPPPIDEFAALGGWVSHQLDEDPERNLATLALRIERQARRFVELTASCRGDEPGPWMAGVPLGLVGIGAHLLFESLVHGFDLARAADQRWTIDRQSALVVWSRFLFPLLDGIDRRLVLSPKSAGGGRLCVELRLRGGPSRYLDFREGDLTVGEARAAPVDCHISADPAALLLVIWRRTSQWPAFARGDLTVWGRKPWRAVELVGMVRTP